VGPNRQGEVRGGERDPARACGSGREGPPGNLSDPRRIESLRLTRWTHLTATQAERREWSVGLRGSNSELGQIARTRPSCKIFPFSFISYFLFSLFEFNLNSDLIQPFGPSLQFYICEIRGTKSRGI
jgi:hypothetical protein